MELVDCDPSADHRTLIDLPYEVVEQILSSEDISYIDICRISEVCRKLHDVTNCHRLWRVKFFQAWKSLSGLYDNQHVDWKEHYQQRFLYGKHVQNLVAMMCEQIPYSHPTDNSFRDFENLSQKHRFASHFMLDELELILYDGNSYSKLTTKFYCSKLLRYARQHHLKKVFQEFLENDNQPLEIGAAIIAQFCQPVERIPFDGIAKKLDDIAIHVKAVIRQRLPKHPILLKDLVPPSVVLNESLWSPSDCKIILACLNTTLFHNLEFLCLHEAEGFSSDQILLDKALEGKIGLPVVIAIIYVSVARRLGVFCELCEPGDSAVRWLEHPALDEVNRYSFIDITKCGKFFTPVELSAIKEIHMYGATEFHVKSCAQVFRNVVKSLTHVGGRDLQYLEERLLYESSALELDLILSPTNEEKILMLVQLYMQMDIQLFDVKSLLQRVRAQDPYLEYRVSRIYLELESRLKAFTARAGSQKFSKIKLRQKCHGVSFAVGMIMKHKKYDYVCVIYGWDEFCRASNHWIQQMRVLELRKKSNQPFYNVLVEDGTQRYAAQENLEICDSPRFIEHSDVGKYFQEFQDTHFVPNAVTSAEYPDDGSAREAILTEFFSSRKATPSDA